MAELIPKAALAFIKNKKLQPGFSYKDVWNEEHAACFTVAKAMQIDVLSDFHAAVTKAVGNGQSFESFKKEIKPILQQKGWWGRKDMVDPKTGETVNAQLGSDRRLKTIYNTNMRQAYSYANYQAAMESDLHPYLMYCLGASKHHRPEHESWNGLILSKHDPWWDNHLPQKEYNCKCNFRAVSEERLRRYEARGGIPIPPSKGGGVIPIKTVAPPEVYHPYVNERKGLVEQIPEGVQPGFNYSFRKIDRKSILLDVLAQKTENKSPGELDNLISSFLSGDSNKADFNNFIENVFKGKKGIPCSSPVGFFDEKIMQFLKTKKINSLYSRIVTLKSSFMGNRIKFKFNRLVKEDWQKTIEHLKSSMAVWDSKNNKIFYISKTNNVRYIITSVVINAKNRNQTIDEFIVLNLDPGSFDPKGDRVFLEHLFEMEPIRKANYENVY
jgi:SPP1 gp7 family putative phage head morphogenesis protein